MPTSVPLLRSGGTLLPAPTEYHALVGGLQYLNLTRPDVAFATNKLSQFMQHPTDDRWGALKRVLMYGRVSHKSDFYSFGMMVLEMVGCKNKVNDNVENSSEMYFPRWIYKQLELGTCTIDCERILNEEEKELERKMMLVGLWCIQKNPTNRPSMTRVVESSTHAHSLLSSKATTDR
ncbi:hypothetical protein V2J09_012652 [Rumex salicifolius]